MWRLLSDTNDAVIAGAIMALAQSMGLHVIAECVETDAQRACPAGLHCDISQG